MKKNEGKSWPIFKRLIGYVKGYKLALGVGIIGMIGYAAVDMLLIWSLQPLIDNGFTGKDPSILEMMPYFVVIVIALRGLAAFTASTILPIISIANQLF